VTEPGKSQLTHWMDRLVVVYLLSHKVRIRALPDPGKRKVCGEIPRVI
jgi:hypothetical protein